MKNLSITPVGPLFIALISTGMLLVGCSEGNTTEDSGNEYATLLLSPESQTLTTSYAATIRGRQDVDIYPEVSGKIIQVNIEEGANVRKGQTLFIIDPVPYRAALHTAQANIRAAQAQVADARLTYESRKTLFAENVISEFDLQTAANAMETAEAQLAQCKAEEERAANDLSYTEVKSPSDGVAGTLPYRVGTLVSATASQPLTTVSDNSEMWVYFSMDENRLLALMREYGNMENALSAMPPVELALSDGSLYPHKGRVQSASGVIDRTTGSVTFKAVFPNESRLLHSGATGDIRMPVTYKEHIIIPQTATYELQDKRFVYKVVDGVARSAEIQVLPQNDGKTFIVRNGLSAGEEIVVEGVGTLRSGTSVNSKKEETL